MKFIKPKRSKPPKPTTSIGSAEDRIFKYFISYAILVTYVLASISSTTDLMLLQSTDGMKLPFVDSRVSIRGFFIAAPLVVAAASLFMAREFHALSIQKGKSPQGTGFIFSVSDLKSDRKIFGVEGKLDAIAIRFFSYCIFFLIGPVVILISLIRFADYQDKLLFSFHLILFVGTTYLSWIYYRRVENLFSRNQTPRFMVPIGIFATFVIGLKLLICFDVIFAPSKYSLTMYLRQHTNWLNNSDGGIVSIVPHLSIDRASSIWRPDTKDYSEIAVYSHNKNARDYFYSRVAGIDLRGRNLKYLDISFQIAPRIWAHDADLSGANLSFTRIPGSNFINTNLYGVNFSMSVVDGSRFFAGTMETAQIANSYFRGAVFDSMNISHVFLRNVNFTGASFFGVKIQESVLDGVNFSGSNFFETKLTDNSMIIDDPSPIFPHSPSTKNEFGEFSGAFLEDEEAALSAIAKQFCGNTLSASDEIALQGITTIFALTDGIKADRMLKLQKKLNELSCDKALEFVPTEKY